ncbi:MAG TPA: CBS domain-containing protein [Flavipsychrobacter sp.]|nr:CBS domain-containing protein [Flavipsychrobacter sp.]
MTIGQLISPSVPQLALSDTGSKALSLMEENNITQLPLVNEGKYISLVGEDDVMDWVTPESPLSAADFLEYKPAVFAQGHPFEALRVANRQHLSVVPVIDAENNYLGSITQEDLLKYITENSGLDNPGGIIVIEVAPRDYSLSEIARICENEEVSIISLQLHNGADGKIEITLKTNRANLSALANSFERRSIIVKEVYGEQQNQDDLMDRFGLLMNYLNM